MGPLPFEKGPRTQLGAPSMKLRGSPTRHRIYLGLPSLQSYEQKIPVAYKLPNMKSCFSSSHKLRYRLILFSFYFVCFKKAKPSWRPSMVTHHKIPAIQEGRGRNSSSSKPARVKLARPCLRNKAQNESAGVT
jgi:hypothetical protein